MCGACDGKPLVQTTDYALGDLGRAQQRAGDVGDAAHRRHVQRRRVGRRGQRRLDQVLHGLARWQRRALVGEVVGTAAEHAAGVRQAQQRVDAHDLVEAALHALARRAEHRPVADRFRRAALALQPRQRAGVLRQQRAVPGRGLLRLRLRRQRALPFAAAVLEGEGRGVHREHVQPLGREQRPRQRELVVDLVGGVGVDHHARPAVGGARLGQALGVPGGGALQHQARGGMFRPRSTAGRATKAFSTRCTFENCSKPTSSPAP